ncbi:MAG: hypothetical protein B7733_13360 [Myxococcales bacterium FL481]|nr:MAG: hypothetical protein B7733_13360 [Myxococcales bacterium FL481]
MDEAEEPSLLPPAAQRQWALEELERLISKTGFSQLVVPPLIEPTEVFFPDRWGGGEQSVARLARRLLHYAGIDDHAVAIEIVEDAPPLADRAHAGAWFAASEPGVCRFGVTSAALREPTELVGALARAVAEAFRGLRGLVRRDTELEARLVDLTAVYLGFGVLTADAAVRHQGRGAGGMQTQRRVTRLGLLGPQLTCFALGVVMQLRDRPGEAKSVHDHLRPNERAFIRAARDWLTRQDPPIRQRLQIPDPATWAPPPSLDDFVGLAELEEGEDEPFEERRDIDRGVVGKNRGQMVFCVERSMARRFGYVGLFGTMMLGGVMARSSQGLEIDMAMISAVGVGLGTVGLLAGRLVRERRCSDPQCGALLPAGAEVCPRCEGTIAGTISDPKERLAAAERLAASQPTAENDAASKPAAGQDAASKSA